MADEEMRAAEVVIEEMRVEEMGAEEVGVEENADGRILNFSILVIGEDDYGEYHFKAPNFGASLSCERALPSPRGLCRGPSLRSPSLS